MTGQRQTGQHQTGQHQTGQHQTGQRQTGQRRGRTGRGWDAAPPRARSGGNNSADNGDTADNGDSDGPGTSGPPGSGVGRTGAGAEGAGADKPADPAEQAREVCLRLLSLRPRTRAELATALRQRGIADEIADEVLERYGEVGIIDDEAFAKAWVTSRHHGRGLARKALAGELRRKGVESETVGAALDDLDPETEAATARALVERKLRADRGAPPEALFRRLVGLLARKGYPAGLAFTVVKELIEERADADAIEAAQLDLAELDPDLLDAEARQADAQAFDHQTDF